MLFNVQSLLGDKQDRLNDRYIPAGFVDTDMTSHKGPLTTDRGAESSVYAALLPPNTDIKGKLLRFILFRRIWIKEYIPNFNIVKKNLKFI